MKVLQLSTYPIIEPRHGGQIRVHNIKKKLQSLRCDVLSLSVSEPTHSVYSNEDDYVINLSAYEQPHNLPFCTDLLTSEQSVKNKKIYSFLKSKIELFNPDIIFIEQPWLWPAVKKMMSDGIINKENIKIVYSSQNIESETKRSILKNFGLTKIDNAIKDIEDLERDLIINADYIFSVSKNDSFFFQKHKNHEPYVLENGVEQRKASEAEKEKVRFLTNHRKYLFFCGSAYPPNAQGFWEMFNASFAQFPPNINIIVAGGVTNILWDYMPKELALSKYVSGTIIKAVGLVSDDTLASLIECSAGIILPITFGGGSNLKTAEAIASHKPVVATAMACRGFDFIDQLSNFYITDNPQEFQKLSRNILQDKINILPISNNEKELRNKVYWENTLSDLENIIKYE